LRMVTASTVTVQTAMVVYVTAMVGNGVLTVGGPPRGSILWEGLR
jgi:hypothetical protein